MSDDRDDEFLTVTTGDPGSLAADGTNTRFTFETADQVFRLQIPREELQAWIAGLTKIDQALETNAAIHAAGRTPTPPRFGRMAFLTLSAGTVSCGTNHVSLRYGSFDDPGQIRIEGKLHDALRAAVLAGFGKI